MQWLAVGLMISSLAVLGASGFAARRAIPELVISRKLVTRPEVVQLVTFGGGLLTIRMLGTIYRQMDKVILGAAAGPRFVAIFDIANKIHAGAATVQSVASSALLPATAFARQSKEVLRDMFLRGSSYTTAVAMPVAIATGVFAAPVIDKWVGDGLDGAVLPTQLFAAYLVLLGMHAVGSTMYVALGHLKPIILIVGASVLMNLAISVALVGPLGVEGVVLGTLLSNVVAWPFLLKLFLDRFGTPLGEWTRVVLVRNLPGVAVQAVLAWPALELANMMPRLVLVLPVFALYVLVSLAAFMLIGLGSDDRGDPAAHAGAGRRPVRAGGAGARGRRRRSAELADVGPERAALQVVLPGGHLPHDGLGPVALEQRAGVAAVLVGGPLALLAVPQLHRDGVLGGGGDVGRQLLGRVVGDVVQHRHGQDRVPALGRLGPAVDVLEPELDVGGLRRACSRARSFTSSPHARRSGWVSLAMRRFRPLFVPSSSSDVIPSCGISSSASHRLRSMARGSSSLVAW